MSIAGTVLIALGLAFMVITALGMIRLPDFYSRVHAVSKSETLVSRWCSLASSCMKAPRW